MQNFTVYGILAAVLILGVYGIMWLLSNFSPFDAGKDVLVSEIEAYQEALGGVESPEEAYEKLVQVQAERDEALAEIEVMDRKLKKKDGGQVDAFRRMIQ